MRPMPQDLGRRIGARRSVGLRASVCGPVVLWIWASACAPEPPKPCDAETAGYADAKPVTRRLLLDVERTTTTTPCRVRVEAILNEADLRRTFEDLGAGDPPPVTWGAESVVLREAPNGKGLRWTVARGDVVTLGVQGCLYTEQPGCRVEIHAVAARASRAELHVCADIECPSPGVESQ